MAFDPHKNLLAGIVKLAPVPSSSGATLTLMPGDVSGFQPNMPVTIFSPLIDVPTRYNAEICYVTAVNGDILTLTRHTEDSIPMQIRPGWRVIASATAKTFTDIEAAIALKADLGDIPDVTGKADKTYVDTQDAAVASSAQAALVVHTSRTDNPHSVTKGQIGLGAVDNTADSAKPVSAAQQTALNSKAALVHTHTAAQVADLITAVSANTDVTANTAARHTHANKATLDTYTQTEANLADAVAKKHSHTNSTVLNATTASFTTADESKLDGITAGATQNTTDAALRDRTTHTGSQPISTVTGLQTALDAKATPTDIDTAIGSLVAAAPAVLNTLDELAAALGDDPNFATTVTTQISGKADASALTAHTGNTSNPHSVTKAQVGLGSVDNTTDAAKPVSTATQTALNLKSNLASPTFTGIPAAPTAAGGTNTTQLATTAFVQANIGLSAANPTLSNLGTTAINTSLISDTTTTDDLGSAAIYWRYLYARRTYLNSTAYFDGATAGYASLYGRLHSPSSNDGMFLYSGDLATAAQLRIHSVTNAYSDSVPTAYFQARYITYNSLTFLGGSAGADSQFERLMFDSKLTTFTDIFYNSVPVPTALVEAIVATNKVAIKVKAGSAQTLNLQEWQDSAGNPKSWIDKDGNFCTKSPDGTSYRITLANGGILTTTAI